MRGNTGQRDENLAGKFKPDSQATWMPITVPIHSQAFTDHTMKIKEVVRFF